MAATTYQYTTLGTHTTTTPSNPTTTSQLIDCICRENDNHSGQLLIKCTGCGSRQHSECMGFRASTTPKGYLCTTCTHHQPQRSFTSYENMSTSSHRIPPRAPSRSLTYASHHHHHSRSGASSQRYPSHPNEASAPAFRAHSRPSPYSSYSYSKSHTYGPDHAPRPCVSPPGLDITRKRRHDDSDDDPSGVRVQNLPYAVSRPVRRSYDDLREPEVKPNAKASISALITPHESSPTPPSSPEQSHAKTWPPAKPVVSTKRSEPHLAVPAIETSPEPVIPMAKTASPVTAKAPSPTGQSECEGLSSAGSSRSLGSKLPSPNATATPNVKTTTATSPTRRVKRSKSESKPMKPLQSLGRSSSQVQPLTSGLPSATSPIACTSNSNAVAKVPATAKLSPVPPPPTDLSPRELYEHHLSTICHTESPKLSQLIQGSALAFYDEVIKVQVKGDKQSRFNVMMQVAVGMLVGCRQHNVPLSFKDVAALCQVNKFELGRTYKKLTQGRQHILMVTSEQYILRFARQLQFSQEMTEHALRVGKEVDEHKVMSGRNCITKASAAVYVTCVRDADSATAVKTKKEVCEVTGVSGATLESCCRILGVNGG